METKSLLKKCAVVLALFFGLIGMTNLNAQEFTVGDLNYRINNDGVSVTVTGHVDGTSASGTLTIPETVQYDNNTYAVTIIIGGAFYNCVGIIDIDLPNSITMIGYRAFINTAWYSSQPDGVLYLGNWCVGYKNISGAVDIREGIIGICDHAFWNFYETFNISSISIPESLLYIGNMAFSCCSLNTINYNAINCETNGSVFYDITCNRIIIGDNVVTLPDFIFADIAGLSEIVIPNSVTTIGSYAFAGISGLSEIVIPSSVTTIGSYAIQGCDGLTSLCLGNSISTIPNSLAKSCPDLISVTIGSSVSYIEDDAFRGCSNLNTIIELEALPPTLGMNVFTGISSIASLFVPCGSQMAYFTNWGVFNYNDIHEDCTQHTISINPNIAYGTITASASTATMGEAVTLYINPDSGHVLQSLVVYNSNNPNQTIDIYNNSFVMLPFDVYIDALFGWYSVYEYDENLASVYPNPTSNIVKIEAENIQNVSVYNMLGEMVFESKANGNEFEYDFSNNESGVYIVRVETAQGVVTKRVTVM